MNVDQKHTQDVGYILQRTWRQGAVPLAEKKYTFKRNDVVKTMEDISGKDKSVHTGATGVVIAVNEKRLVARIQNFGDLNVTVEEASHMLSPVPVYTTMENRIRHFMLHEQYTPGQWVKVTGVDPRQNIWKFRPVYPGMVVIGERGQILFPIFSIPGILTMYRVMLNSGEWEFTDQELELIDNPQQ